MSFPESSESKLSAVYKKTASYNGKSVGIIGSGPAGLAAAQFLAERGYLVTVYEKEILLGGSLRAADSNNADRRIQDLKKLSVLFELCAEVGVDYPHERVRVENDMMVIAVGAEQPVPECLLAAAAGTFIPGTNRTGAPDIFACGECCTGKTVPEEALADGLRCGAAVDAYLREST